MKFFFSGSSVVGKYMVTCAEHCPWRLMSCHGNYARYLDVWMQGALEKGNEHQEIMLDSGAFTAWSKGEQVKVNNLIRVYRSFIRKYGKHSTAIWLINLDRIPGSKTGPEPSQDEIIAAMHESDKNFDILTHEFGPIVLPVFHQGEPFSRLHDVAAQAEYICVSPRNDFGEKVRVSWSQHVHTRIKNKTHGLATTGQKMATTVPWHSTDSAAWAIRAALGMVFFNFDGHARSVFISRQSPTQHDYDVHYDAMPKVKQDYLHDKIASRGFTVDELRDVFRARAAFSMLELIDWNYEKRFDIRNMPDLFG